MGSCSATCSTDRGWCRGGWRCGLVGGPLIFASAIAVLFGAYEQDGAHFLFSIPEIAFRVLDQLELPASIAVYTIVKGFRPSPILDARYGGAGGPAPAPQ